MTVSNYQTEIQEAVTRVWHNCVNGSFNIQSQLRGYRGTKQEDVLFVIQMQIMELDDPTDVNLDGMANFAVTFSQEISEKEGELCLRPDSEYADYLSQLIESEEPWAQKATKILIIMLRYLREYLIEDAGAAQVNSLIYVA